MKLINHEYESLNECLKAMIDGQVFWIDGDKIFYHDQTFLVLEDGSLNGVGDYLFNYDLQNYWEQWQIEVKPHWTDNLSKDNPVLCWVSEGARQRKPCLALVTSFDGELYKSEGSTVYAWESANPVKPDDPVIYKESE